MAINLFRTKVMMAISSSGTLTPPIFNEKTSLVSGHGSIVDMLAVMSRSRRR